MVSTPENSWVKPISRPSAKVSTSATIRLTMSPEGWLSRYERGRVWIFRMAALRRSRLTAKVMRLLQTLSSHCAKAATTATTMIS